MAKKRSPIDDFLALTPEDRERVAAEFDKEFVADTFRPLSAKSRRAWKRAKAKRGRPRVGEGSQRVMMTIERRLLREVDAAARRLGVSRSQLAARGLREVIGKPARRAA